MVRPNEVSHNGFCQMLVSPLPGHKAYFALVASLAPIALRVAPPTLALALALGFDPTDPNISILRAYDIHHCLQSTSLVRNACFSLDRPAMEGNQDTEILRCQRIGYNEFTTVVCSFLGPVYL